MNTPSSSSNRDVIEKLFLHMNSIYGATWKSQFKDATETMYALNLWSRELSNLSVYEARKISDYLVNQRAEKKFPPSLPEVIAIRGNIRDPEATKQLGFEHTPLPKEQARKYVEKIRGIMAKNDPYEGSSHDQRSRAYQVLKRPGQEATLRAHAILREHLSGG